jgi:hypothetical protein
MSCAKQIFSHITQGQFNCLVQKAAASGLPLDGAAGQASKNGFTVSWVYDSATQTLEIQCLSAPFLVPCSIINGKIHELVEECAT